MINGTQTQLEFPMVMGQPYETLPDDLFIPPNALELCLESFSGPMDLLLYLIKKENINILELDVSEITQQYVQYIELMDILKFELAAEYLVMAATLAEGVTVIESAACEPEVSDLADPVDLERLQTTTFRWRQKGSS